MQGPRLLGKVTEPSRSGRGQPRRPYGRDDALGAAAERKPRRVSPLDRYAEGEPFADARGRSRRTMSANTRPPRTTITAPTSGLSRAVGPSKTPATSDTAK